MVKIAFMGAGSTVFVRNVIGDCMQHESLCNAEVALYDIDAKRLHESLEILTAINDKTNASRMKFQTFCGVANRRAALAGANFVVNAIQVGGYEPSTVIDFEIPKKYGLRQTIGDTLGIGGIFRALRTIPVMMDFASDMEAVCPDAWFLNYSNPMAMLTGALLTGSSVKAVGLCHSVQGVGYAIFEAAGMKDDDRVKRCNFYVAGINHMAWLLRAEENGVDIYPELKQKAFAKLDAALASDDPKDKYGDMVRVAMMRRLGYYITESSEHNSEYTPLWIKSRREDLIAKYAIPLDEYPRRCVNQIAAWEKEYAEICAKSKEIEHKLSLEYGSYIMNAIMTNEPYQINGNILNHGLISNLPANAVVEVPCLVNKNGVQGCYVGALPEQCAAFNRTNINVQLLTIEAALKRKKDAIYQAAMLDPHTAGELAVDEIVALCDDLIAAHGAMLPAYF